MLIQVDVDSTLYDANALFYKIGREEFGIDWPKKYYEWFGPEDIGTDLKTLKNVFRRCHSKEIVAQTVPFPGAREVLNALAENYESVEIAYVSDRNEAQTAALQDWLQAHGFLSRGDEYVAATKDKREWMRERKPEIVIDDRVRTIIMARFELGAEVVSLIHPHNMNLRGEVEGVYLCKDWKEIGETLDNVVIPKIQTKVIV